MVATLIDASVGYVVEFCGLPGAGKSTLARAVVAQLRLRGLPTTDVMATLGPDAARSARVARKFGATVAGLGETSSARVVMGVALRSAQEDRRDQLARPANLLVVRHAVARARRRPGVHVLDQGPLQEWWSAALRANDNRVLKMAAKDRAPRSHLVVEVRAPIDLLVDRLEARGERQSRLEALDTAARVIALQRGEALLAGLIDQLVHSLDSEGPAVLTVDGLDPSACESIVGAVVGSR